MYVCVYIEKIKKIMENFALARISMLSSQQNRARVCENPVYLCKRERKKSLKEDGYYRKFFRQ